MKKYRKQWRLTQLQNFAQELSHLLAAGLPLFSALTLLQEYSHDKAEIKLATHLQQKIVRGLAFSIAWEEVTQEKLSSILIAVGEKAGALDRALQYIEQYAATEKNLKLILWQALRYPVFLLILTVVLLSLLCAWVIPQFSLLYANFNVAIPWLTRMIIQASHSIQAHTEISFLGIIFLLSMGAIFKKHPIARKFFYFIKRKFSLYREIQELRFLQVLNLLLGAGVPLSEALGAAQKSFVDEGFGQYIRYIVHQLKQGEKLGAILKQMDVFSPKLTAILTLGEVSGKLETLLKVYIDQQHHQLAQKVQAFKAWLEPIFLCVIGGIVGVVLVALYLPILEFGKWV